jgi:hypothetical protein
VIVTGEPGLVALLLIVSKTPPVEGSASTLTAFDDAAHVSSPGLTPVTLAGTWNVCVVSPGMIAEYIGENTIASAPSHEEGAPLSTTTPPQYPAA